LGFRGDEKQANANVIHNDNNFLIYVDLDHLDPAHYLLYTQKQDHLFWTYSLLPLINLRPFQNSFTLLENYNIIILAINYAFKGYFYIYKF